MHDPMFVAAELRRPWPRTTARFASNGATWRSSWPFVNIAGRQLYFPSLVTVWHVEPGGADAGEVCGWPHGWELLRHLDHLQLQVPMLQDLRRRLLTRCAWCGGPSRKGDWINLRAPGVLADDDRAELPWWHGEQGLMHWGCSTVADAWRSCVCPVPDLRSDAGIRGFGWSWCSLCGKSRWHDSDVGRQRIYELIRSRSERGVRPDRVLLEEVKAHWALWRAAKEDSDA